MHLDGEKEKQQQQRPHPNKYNSFIPVEDCIFNYICER